MSSNAKSLLAFVFLELCEDKGMKTITVKQLLEAANISRQTFYNNFKDINDLICWIYVNKIWEGDRDPAMKPVKYDREGWYKRCIRSYERQKRYLRFMQYAYRNEGQNCLMQYAIETSYERESKLIKDIFNISELSPRLQHVLRTNAYGQFSVLKNWILDGMEEPTIEEMARYNMETRYNLFECALEAEGLVSPDKL